MNRDKLDEIDNSNFKETEKGASGDFSPVDVVQKSEVVGHESSNGGGKDDESTAVTARKYSDIDKKEPEMTGLSKNQLKKLRKIQKWEQFKGIKRKKEKEKKRAKRQALRDAGVEGTKKRKVSMASDKASSIRVALDLSFNELMTEKDQRKVVKQVLRSYSMNRQAKHPLQLHLTNFEESNKELFGKFSTGYKTWDVHLVEENHVEKFDKSELVYLTSDSSNILKELDETKVYVIGGIVDHNAHKGLCFGLAEKAGIGHARLPIDEYIKLEGRKVLPINHVFEILLHFVEFSDWEKAFYHVIPKRKGLTSHEKQSRDSSCTNQATPEEDEMTGSHEEQEDSENTENKDRGDTLTAINTGVEG